MIRTALTITAFALAVPAVAQTDRTIGAETTIPYSASGAIRQYQVDRQDPRIVYMQDGRMRWYRVTLSGACLPTSNAATLITRTRGSDNRLDRFSLVGSSRFPGRLCGIESIKTALPPVGQPGAAKAGAPTPH